MHYRRHITALHGFLGHPNDFKVLNLENLQAPNIFLSEPCPLEKWAARFNATISKKTALLGYSMGGRLALHCLLAQPDLYSCAIIVAAHPGLKFEAQRSKRAEQDLAWARKFKTMAWAELMTEWEAMPALKTSIPISRREENYHRPSLASAMRYFSLGSQSYLVPAINSLNIPILWLAPKSESANIEGLKFSHPLSQLVILNGGHRFIFEKPVLATKLIVQFLKKCTTLRE